MQPDERDEGFLWDMLTYSERVAVLTGRTHFDAYNRDWTVQLAMERALEVIGEAARKVSREFRGAHPEIPWSRIIAHRHFLAHEYGEVEQERIWETATIHIPELIALLRPLLPQYPPEGKEV